MPSGILYEGGKGIITHPLLRVLKDKKMYCLLLSLTIFMASACAGRAELIAPQGTSADKTGDVVSRAFHGAKSVKADEVSVVGPTKEKIGKTTADIIADLKDDDILIDIGGMFRLKWGVLRRHVEVLCKNIDRPDMQVEGNEAAKKIAFQSMCRQLLKDYIEHGVFALEARRLGIVVGDDEFRKYREKARESYMSKGETGKALIGLMESGESFYEHNLTNALYWKAYREQIVEPKIELPDDDVRKFIEMRHEYNLRVVATNNFKKALIKEVFAKLCNGLDFGEAAAKWSDDDSSDTKGVMMDDHGEVTLKFEKDDLDTRIATRCWNMAEGELSGVIETPYAWHIVKLLKHNSATDDEEETIEFAQIKLSKDFIKPEFSEREARERARALILRAAMRANFAELLGRTHIESKIPLGDENGVRRKIKRIK